MLKNSSVGYKWIDLIFKDKSHIYGVFISDNLEDRSEEKYYQCLDLSRTHYGIPYGEGNVRQRDKIRRTRESPG